MSLDFGFYYYDSRREAEATEKFQALSEEDKNFYHKLLPLILMFTDISKVTPTSIPHIVKRLKIYSPDLVIDEGNADKPMSEEALMEYLQRFIGFAANVYTLTSAEYIRKLAKRMTWEIPRLTKRDINKVMERNL